MASVSLVVPLAHDGTAFDIAVVVDGCTVGAQVTCTLTQDEGIAPFIPDSPKTKQALGAKIIFTYHLQLTGPATCGLTASVSDDQGAVYGADSQQVKINP